MTLLEHVYAEARIARDEARAILRGFQGALASMSFRQRADIAARSEGETIGQDRIEAKMAKMSEPSQNMADLYSDLYSRPTESD
jgi:hypothetical protein